MTRRTLYFMHLLFHLLCTTVCSTNYFRPIHLLLVDEDATCVSVIISTVADLAINTFHQYGFSQTVCVLLRTTSESHSTQSLIMLTGSTLLAYRNHHLLSFVIDKFAYSILFHAIFKPYPAASHQLSSCLYYY